MCPSNTSACTSAINATDCFPTFTLVAGQCICDPTYQQFLDINTGDCDSCTALIDGCFSCISAATPSGVGCTSCASGLFINSSLTCEDCPPTCTTCSGLLSCNNCQPTFSLLNGTCACDPALQLFTTGSLCAPCYSFINHCLNCSGTGPSSVTCLECSPGTYPDLTNSSCLTCPANCPSCDSTGCLNCTHGFNLTLGGCVFLDGCQGLGADPNCILCLQVANSSSVNC